MASIFGSWGSDPFADLVEKATSELLPAGQEDIALNLEICDQVRAKQVPAKQAMQTLKRRVSHKNPNVVLLALGLTDICIKNGGDHFLAEVASREFMDNLASILRSPSGLNFDVKTKTLRLIQNWSQIAETKPYQMGYITETYKSLKSSGFDFPTPDPNTSVSAALVETLTAPEWTDSEVCMRCRTSFTTFNRKHHCRNCGNVFCQDCSSRLMSLPWFGVGQDVRVCDGCFAKKAPPSSSAQDASSKIARSKTLITPTGRGGVGSHQRSNTVGSNKTRASSSRKKEDDDLALAIKLSLESSGSTPSRPDFASSKPSVREGRATRQADGRMLEGTDADDDPDLAAAIAASLRDYAPPQPSAPDEDGRTTPRYADGTRAAYETRLPLPPSLELPVADIDAILTFTQGAQAQERYARQHGVWQGNTIQQQQLQMDYERATASRPHMAKSLDEATRRHGVLRSMHDKLSEAVRLYDRLLDAQMSRPMYDAYGQPLSHGEAYAHDPRTYAAQHDLAPQPVVYGQQHVPVQSPYSQAQGMATQSLYPGVPSQSHAPVGVSAPYYVNVDRDANSVQPSSQGLSAAASAMESPSPYPSHQGYFSPNTVHKITASNTSTTHQLSAQEGVESTAYHQANPISPLRQASDAGYAAVPHASFDQVGNASNNWMTRRDDATAAPSVRYENGTDAHPAAYYGARQATSNVIVPPSHHKSSYDDVANVSNVASAALADNARATMSLNPTTHREGESLTRQQEAAPQHRSSTIDSTVSDQQRGWQNVPITHSNASIIASAPSAPHHQMDAYRSHEEQEQVGASRMPVMPSAPLTSPTVKSPTANAYPVPYNDTISSPPSSSVPSQPWTRAIETPLIDL